MEIGGETYNSVEQFYVQQKAFFGGDLDRAAEVMKMTDPQKIMMLGKKVKVVEDQWKKKEMDVMLDGVRQKFQQNKALEKRLLETVGELLVESTRNQFWGCGKPMYSKQSNDVNQWTGQNQLGKMLMRVRAETLENNRSWATNLSQDVTSQPVTSEESHEGVKDT